MEEGFEERAKRIQDDLTTNAISCGSNVNAEDHQWVISNKNQLAKYGYHALLWEFFTDTESLKKIQRTTKPTAVVCKEAGV